MSDDAGDLARAAAAVAHWLRRSGVPGALIGGVAAAALGRPRATRDVDVLVWLPLTRDWPAAVARLAPDLVFRPGGSLAFAEASRVLLLRHVATGVDVDVALGLLPIEQELVESARLSEDSGLALPLPRPEHLVVMKALAGRPRDLIDIEGILEVQPALDRAWVLRVVAEHADVLEMPELAAAVEALMARVPAR